MKIEGLVVAALLSLIALPEVQAQTAAVENALKTAITEASEGNCPESLMTPLLRGQCMTQQPQMGERLNQRGAIEAVQFLGTQGTPSGEAEVYQVEFEQGAMTWMAALDESGKLAILWAPE